MRTHIDTRTGETKSTLTNAEVRALQRAIPIMRGLIGEIEDSTAAQAVHRAASVLQEIGNTKSLEVAHAKEEREAKKAEKAKAEKKASKKAESFPAK